MWRHNEMPPVPPANRSHKGTLVTMPKSARTRRRQDEVNTAEQGETANIKQYTHQRRFFQGTACEVTPNCN
jgi:hypothetical protein